MDVEEKTAVEELPEATQRLPAMDPPCIFFDTVRQKIVDRFFGLLAMFGIKGLWSRACRSEAAAFSLAQPSCR